jgi:hypothetical protein
VYRLISTGTIEEMMYIRQIYKTQVAEAATTQQGAGPRQFNAVHGAKGEEGELFGTYCKSAEPITEPISEQISRRELQLSEL